MQQSNEKRAHEAKTARIYNDGDIKTEITNWDGESWFASVVDPYASPAPLTAGHLPAVVGTGLVGSGSVVYLEAHKLFVLMG